jgi:hypothetical protein
VSYQSTTISNPGTRPRITTRVRVLAILGATVLTIVAIALMPRIQQDESYHNFADKRLILGIANFLNVMSNLPFLLCGIAGLLFLARTRKAVSGDTFVHWLERWPYALFFLGVSLTCAGSAYYHLSPNTDRLMWDRLPMSIAFMALLAVVITERIDMRAGLVSLAPLVLVGAGSVIYWRVGEMNGSGDLRPYALVQFYSMLAVIICSGMFHSRYSHGRWLFVAVGWYAAAKLFELLDRQVFAMGQIVSGHSVKHIAAAISAYCILDMLKRRSQLTAKETPALML